jgi:hypothetical protein
MDDSSPIGSGSGHLRLPEYSGNRISFGSLMSPDNSYPLELDAIKEEIVSEDDYSEYKLNMGLGRAGSRHEKGTFWPEKPKNDPGLSCAVKASTVLTNLQRGNIPTIMQTAVEPVVLVRFDIVEALGYIKMASSGIGKS